ncbi:hypothetical protein DID88_007186 [Monilinia fructigena]|uniref:Thioredoxin domain-containing protein n=1 Tax=Monilinia fructigena TaxID=38457 RepID=A0A395J8K4_9HELO|nr:hypothetical protein DID88_007186 [Monilinia fructigena]
MCLVLLPTEGNYTYASAKGATVNSVNTYTKGWDLENTTRLIWTNGQYDPWRTSGVSSQFRPGGELQSTAQHPVLISRHHKSKLSFLSLEINHTSEKQKRIIKMVLLKSIVLAGLATFYEQLAQDFAFAKDKVTIAKVDADAEKSLGKKFGVQGFPTIKYFDGKSKTPEDYSGGRDIDSLTEFITKKTGIKPKKAKAAPSAVEMLTDKSFKEQIGSDKDVIVAFTAPWCGHCKTLAPIWEKVAQDFINEPNVVIAKVDAEAESSKATAKDQGVTSYPTIKFFPKGSTEAEAYSGGRSEKDLVEFLNSKAGTHRAVGGGLDATAGTIEALDALVSKFTGGSSIAEVAAEAAKAAQEI